MVDLNRQSREVNIPHPPIISDIEVTLVASAQVADIFGGVRKYSLHDVPSQYLGA